FAKAVCLAASTIAERASDFFFHAGLPTVMGEASIFKWYMMRFPHSSREKVLPLFPTMSCNMGKAVSVNISARHMYIITALWVDIPEITRASFNMMGFAKASGRFAQSIRWLVLCRTIHLIWYLCTTFFMKHRKLLLAILEMRMMRSSRNESSCARNMGRTNSIRRSRIFARGSHQKSSV
ncbi:hypothetical protein, partial [uncultured Selenomonas sp.]|uniref:hypothetical protein n=1 Tax=uncultured Selenomonas sp. TaxID=159275 RepID=UPI0025E0CA0E